MNSHRSIKTSFTAEKLVFGCLVALSLLVSSGCRPVGSGSLFPFGGNNGGGLFSGGGLFNRSNDLASTATGFAGGFGQSVFWRSIRWRVDWPSRAAFRPKSVSYTHLTLPTKA